MNKEEKKFGNLLLKYYCPCFVFIFVYKHCINIIKFTFFKPLLN